jgi:hypothetical protein
MATRTFHHGDYAHIRQAMMATGWPIPRLKTLQRRGIVINVGRGVYRMNPGAGFLARKLRRAQGVVRSD